ncbi:RDD family protein [Sulfuricurvum sp.]|uniref:RDD family protein n=1 Tax=Sulfuricurvum sp. TaxID=2025608 RepID=UPI003BB6276C
MENDELEYAGFWIRTGATLIDTVLFIMIAWPLLFAIYGSDYLEISADSLAIGPADVVINYIFPFIAAVILWIYKAGTPGKLVLGLHVVDAQSGEHLAIGQAIGRYLAYIPAMLALMMGIFWVAWDSKKQGWHDKLAGTVVIRQKNRVEKVKFS